MRTTIVSSLTLFVLACGGDGDAAVDGVDEVDARDAVDDADPEDGVDGVDEDAADTALDTDDAVAADEGGADTPEVVPDDPAIVPYDRDDRARLTPFPDDTLLVADASQPTGHRFALPTLERPDDALTVLSAIAVEAQKVDGFSPVAPLVVALGGAIDRTSVPLTERASLAPDASVRLYDLDPASATYLTQRAFDLVIKDEVDKDGAPSHVLIVFPTAPLAPRGRYALVVTTAARLASGAALAPSPYMRRVARDPSHPSGDVLDRLARATPPVAVDDVALAVSVSVRSIDRVPDDVLAVRAALQTMAPPAYTIATVEPDGADDSAVAAVVSGTWDAPDWRDGIDLARDADGRPRLVGTRPIPFTLALPKAGARAPLIFYMHGNPGSAEVEVPAAGRRFGPAGFAAIGFTDIGNREYIQGSGSVAIFTNVIFVHLLQKKKVPDAVNLLDTLDQLAFIRFIGALRAELDVVGGPTFGTPDGELDLDPDAPLLFEGISHGSFTGVGLLAYAPEIHAAALVVGGSRYTSSIVHQESDGPAPQHLYETVTAVFPSVRHDEFWAGIAIFQASLDAQEHVLHGMRLYRDKHDLGDDARASVLHIEGLGDSYVPVYSTRCAAHALGIPQVEQVEGQMDPVPQLDAVAAPVRGNIDATTTAGLVQFVADGVPGFTATPGCVTRHLRDGHFCAQACDEAVAIQTRFFLSALEGVPAVTLDPAP